MSVFKAIFKFMVASTLILGGVLVGGTIFAAKSVDKAGDKLQDELEDKKD